MDPNPFGVFHVKLNLFEFYELNFLLTIGSVDLRLMSLFRMQSGKVTLNIPTLKESKAKRFAPGVHVGHI